MRALHQSHLVLAALLSVVVPAGYPAVGHAQDTISAVPVRPRAHRVRLSDRPPPALELTAGVRARVLAVDYSGTRLRLEGIVLDAQPTSFRMTCMITSSRPASIPKEATPKIAQFACDSGMQEIMWSQVEEFRIRRAQRASAEASFANGAAGALEGGLVASLVGAGLALITQVAWTSVAEKDGEARPRIYWPDVRNVAIGFGGVGAVAGGASAWLWSNGHWIKMRLPGVPD